MVVTTAGVLRAGLDCAKLELPLAWLPVRALPWV
jgi:hypothetical protein